MVWGVHKVPHPSSGPMGEITIEHVLLPTKPRQGLKTFTSVSGSHNQSELTCKMKTICHQAFLIKVAVYQHHNYIQNLHVFYYFYEYSIIMND